MKGRLGSAVSSLTVEFEVVGSNSLSTKVGVRLLVYSLPQHPTKWDLNWKFSVEIPTDTSKTPPPPPPPYPEPSPPLTNQTKYDVFISFSGKDIREGFLSHLTKELSRKQIYAFFDTKLHQGGEISVELLQAIERSQISLVVFSESYASSSWCLDELVKIMECRREQGQIVIPVFYRVEPSDVRHQKGVFSEDFAKQEKRHIGKEKVQTWRSAFAEAANISGFHSSKFG
ncbi:hypothetical protein PIB30_006265 [Stylosanthes scabra]|uniref:TIR domain-containing protein n=1 Tax=Stylosanthes scabra TaxID=79078 RepID=A0ABU6Q537_9FABA|nr:hypothetical protein [Stylosanthes scabra]